MQIICISCGSQSQGEEFSQNLAEKLGYECLSREQLLEEATRHRIPIGKLETAIIKPHLLTDKLVLELEHYKALATSIICEKALKNNILYYGRTGHLLLPGIAHILKLRVVSDMEYRINHVIEKMQVPREKAKQYIEQIDEDRRKWVRKFYNTDWDVFNLYDLVINLSHMNTSNAASSICSIAQLPEFQATPSSMNALKDLYLESKAQLLLFQDRSTDLFNARIKAHNGILNITYPANLAGNIENINTILKSLDDIKEIVYTKAQTNILWIQEQFNETDSSYNKVLSVANNWDAAVELLKLIPDENQQDIPVVEDSPEPAPETWRETGIIAEGEETSPEVSKDMLKIYEKLITDGRSGGKKTIIGSQKTLINSIDKSANYRLIVLDNMFLSKGDSTRKRLIRECSNSIIEEMKTPVVNLDELETKYQFRSKNIIKLLINAFLTVIIVFLIFHFSTPIIEFLSRTGSGAKIISTICILIFVPVFAYIYSTVTGLLLKLMKFE